MSKPMQPFIELPLEELKGKLRIWVDTNQKPYKIEVRSKLLMGYWNVEDLSKVIVQLADAIKVARK